MDSLFATTLGLAFTLFVCIYAAHALVSPWLRVRRQLADKAGEAAETHSTQPQGTASAYRA